MGGQFNNLVAVNKNTQVSRNEHAVPADPSYSSRGIVQEDTVVVRAVTATVTHLSLQSLRQPGQEDQTSLSLAEEGVVQEVTGAGRGQGTGQAGELGQGGAPGDGLQVREGGASSLISCQQVLLGSPEAGHP